MKFGGLGSAVSELLATHQPFPLEMVAVNDSFGESGTPDQLMIKYGLDSKDIVKSAKQAISRKKA
jgi:transketolase